MLYKLLKKCLFAGDERDNALYPLLKAINVTRKARCEDCGVSKFQTDNFDSLWFRNCGSAVTQLNGMQKSFFKTKCDLCRLKLKMSLEIHDLDMVIIPTGIIHIHLGTRIYCVIKFLLLYMIKVLLRYA